MVFPALTIVLEALPLGAVCTFAPSPTERVRETFSYFSLIPFGYANFAPLITAILTVVILLLSLISLKKDSVFNALFVLSIITAIISLMGLMYGIKNSPLGGVFKNHSPKKKNIFFITKKKKKKKIFDISHILGNLITVIFDYQILRKPLKILSL